MPKTNNYEMFKFLDLNRSLNRNVINALKNSITKNGYIGSPILVNNSYEIIDGQHRFVALKEMGLEVPYEIVDASYSAIIDLNTTQHNWDAQDYVNFYCEKDHNQHYLRLRRLCKELNTSVTNILDMSLGKRTSGQDFLRIKRGLLVLTIDDELRIRSFYNMMKEVTKLLKMKITGRVCASLIELSNKPKFKWSTLIDKASKYPTMAYNCRTRDEFIVMFRDLYNYNTKKAELRI